MQLIRCRELRRYSNSKKKKIATSTAKYRALDGTDQVDRKSTITIKQTRLSMTTNSHQKHFLLYPEISLPNRF